MTCYAASLGNCSGGITQEHYISRSALEVVGKAVQVTGYPWQEAGESENVGINALTSGILCGHHNSELSPLDDVGSTFLRALKSIFDQASTSNPFTAETWTIDGHLLELWLLKVLCGVFAIHGMNVPERWVQILFQKQRFPPGAGIFSFGKPGQPATWFFTLIRIISVTDDKGNISGAKFGLGGLAFLLSFARPHFHDEAIRSSHRPQGIQFEKDSNVKRIDFVWGDSTPGESLILKFGGPIATGGDKPIPIVQPWRKQKEE